MGALAVTVWTYALAVPEPTDVLPTRIEDGAPLRGSAPAVTLAAHLGAPLLRGNEIDLLVNGEEIFPPMLASIRGARESVDLLSYIYWTGDVARQFADELSAAAARGVEVRVLLDAYGANQMRPALVEQMRRAGCRVAWFHPIRWYTLRRLNNRTHRKVLVVDRQVGFTGGVGIAEEWTGDAQDADHWRDDHFRVTGPAVRYLLGAFAENWRQATGEVIAGSSTAAPVNRPSTAVPANGASTAADTQGASVVPILSAPGTSISEVAFVYWLSLRAARQRVRIATPYFVPDSALAAELAATARRGVEVTLLVPGRHNDSRLVRYGSRVLYEDLLQAGVRIFEYEPTMMHAKTMTVD
nr:cardiolipin synthase B [Gemmatimonadota bacterium]